MESPSHQLNRLANQWHVSVARTLETNTSLLAFGLRDDARVVIKLSKHPGDEWNSGTVLHALAGDGVVSVLEFEGGAVLLEQLVPGHDLVGTVRQGSDEEATRILAQVIARIANHAPPSGCPTILDWANGFRRYRERKIEVLPPELVHEAEESYLKLAHSQSRTMLLHGDLQHYNVVFDERRGWTAIDPKGVIGELEYEVGAILRNPVELPELFTSRQIIESRLRILGDQLHLNHERALEWAFAQAVLSAVWQLEDREPVNESILSLAKILRSMLRSRS
jgi:streptomycin 6-kinase